ncbi:hypothetical protein P8452_50890 [Trifolium repens]|nr:hypothetical protein P8452_50890 [Trifolium repens]
MLLPVAVTTVVFLLCLESISKFKIQIPPLSFNIQTHFFTHLSLHESTILDGTSHNLRFSSQSNPTTSFKIKTHPARLRKIVTTVSFSLMKENDIPMIP